MVSSITHQRNRPHSDSFLVPIVSWCHPGRLWWRLHASPSRRVHSDLWNGLVHCCWVHHPLRRHYCFPDSILHENCGNWETDKTHIHTDRARVKNWPAWLLDDVICMSNAICCRSDIGVVVAARPELLEPLAKFLGRDVDGIFLFTFWNMMHQTRCNYNQFGCGETPHTKQNRITGTHSRPTTTKNERKMNGKNKRKKYFELLSSHTHTHSACLCPRVANSHFCPLRFSLSVSLCVCVDSISSFFSSRRMQVGKTMQCKNRSRNFQFLT